MNRVGRPRIQRIRFGALCLVAQALSGAAPAEPPTPIEVAIRVQEALRTAQEALSRVQDYTGLLIMQERFAEWVLTRTMEFKVQRPFAVYAKLLEPNKGREFIFRPGWNQERLRVHNGSFPDITLNLDPFGNRAMAYNHHPLHEFGLENALRFLTQNFQRALADPACSIAPVQQASVFDEPVLRLEMHCPRSGRFVTADSDTAWTLARKTGQDMYVLLYNNPQLRGGPNEVIRAAPVFVPDYYGGRLEAYFHSDTALLRKLVVYDFQGQIYESYEFPRLRTNVGLGPRDFDADNPDYDF